jgi:hypothetical protein
MKMTLKQREGNILLVVGIALLLFWLLAMGSSSRLGGFVYVALLVGCIFVVVAVITRLRGSR